MLTLESEVVSSLASMVQGSLSTSEVELRMTCGDAQLDALLRHLLHNKHWTNTTKHSFTDHISKNVRTRYEEGKKGITTKKAVIDQKMWMVGDELEEGFVVKACHSSEETQRARHKREIAGMRFIERYSFTHKGYIRFDISKSVNVESAAYTQQSDIAATCHVEVELCGSHAPYESTRHPSKLYALSMLMKINDMICVLNRVPCDTKLQWQTIKK